MKLQIVEYRALNMLEGNIHYRYILELDEKAVLWTSQTPKKKYPKKVYRMLMREMLNKDIDYNIEHYVKLNKWPGVERKVIFEEEVHDTFLKELHIKQRIQAIEEDFK